MKLTPLGKKLTFYKILALVGLLGMLLSFQFSWVPAFWLCVLCLIIGAAQVLSIGLNARHHKFNYKGERHGPDILWEYEPGDEEYEREKQWQDNDDPVTIDVDIKITSKEL